MISELNDDEMLDFLMTSDFDQEYKPEEFKYLLIKWRYFYRLMYGKLESTKLNSETKIKEVSDKLKISEKNLFQERVSNSDKKNFIDSLANKKLTFKERLSGKISIKYEN